MARILAARVRTRTDGCAEHPDHGASARDCAACADLEALVAFERAELAWPGIATALGVRLYSREPCPTHPPGKPTLEVAKVCSFCDDELAFRLLERRLAEDGFRLERASEGELEQGAMQVVLVELQRAEPAAVVPDSATKVCSRCGRSGGGGFVRREGERDVWVFANESACEVRSFRAERARGRGA